MIYDEILSSNQNRELQIHGSCKKNLRNITSIKFYSIYLQFWNHYKKLYLLTEGIRNRNCKFAKIVVI